jgi:hypothetical protein
MQISAEYIDNVVSYFFERAPPELVADICGTDFVAKQVQLNGLFCTSIV